MYSAHKNNLKIFQKPIYKLKFIVYNKYIIK
nr:MAG TPA: hypothetical protein [Caudoviricetes sp.]